MKTPDKRRTEKFYKRRTPPPAKGRLIVEKIKKDEKVRVQTMVRRDLREEFKYYCWSKEGKGMSEILENMIKAYIMRKRDV